MKKQSFEWLYGSEASVCKQEPVPNLAAGSWSALLEKARFRSNSFDRFLETSILLLGSSSIIEM